MSLPSSKYYDPEQDLPELAEELVYVDRHFTSASPQSEHRRWEYAMALRALYVWEQEGHKVNRVVDVGGAGSPFWRMIGTTDVHVVDPHENVRLEDYVRSGTPLASAVFCLSVLEHVEDLDQFLYHLSCLVAPGGLLFLTVDCCGCWGPTTHIPTADPHHFSHMRKRIFTPGHLSELSLILRGSYDFSNLTGSQHYEDYRSQLYGGPDGGYSFASLALVKRA